MRRYTIVIILVIIIAGVLSGFYITRKGSGSTMNNTKKNNEINKNNQIKKDAKTTNDKVNKTDKDKSNMKDRNNNTNKKTDKLNTNTKQKASNTSDTASAYSKTDLGKVLIVYYSLTGNTDKVANTIKDITGGDIFRIEPDFDYSQVKSRTEMEELGKKQVDEDFRPKLKNSVENFDAYDTVIVGSPVWWYHVTPPVMSFLTQYDFKDKKVVPFCTCGSVYGDFFKQFEGALPGVNILKGFDITEPEIKEEESMKEKIKSWLEEL